MLHIILDAMGGDKAPFINIEGVVGYLRDSRSRGRVTLVGRRDVLEPLLEKYQYPTDRLSIYHAEQVLAMDESPTRSYREKPKSSIRVGLELVKTGQGDAFISAGNTGAVMAYSLLTLGRIAGVDRPCVGAFMPHDDGATLLLDVGAVSQVKPKNLLQFAIMGDIVVRKILGKTNPRVALLSIGEESRKGTALVKEAKRLLEESRLNFVGYAEGRDIFTDKIDVVVTDGFTGNVALKLAESSFKTLFDLIKSRLTTPTARLGAFLMRRVFRELKVTMDPNTYGGSPLLGVKGISIICHGSSTATGITNALFEAQHLHEMRLIQSIEDDIQESLKTITYHPEDEEVIAP